MMELRFSVLSRATQWLA